MRRAFVVLFALLAAGWIGWTWMRGPSPEEILASLEVPTAPVLSPEEERATFRTAPGFRVELVASEPLVVDPVAMDWDDEGRLYVVEMRGYMPDVDGKGEDAPVGRVVVLEDLDGDGRMDESRVFLDGLVLPRAVAVVPEGVLVAEPPHLWLCRATDTEGRCADRIRLGSYAEGRSNPEHQENGLLVGIDNWIYNARSQRRFRLANDAFEVESTRYRGQFGIAQDDEGRLFYNHNSGFLYGDAIPADYLERQPAAAAAPDTAGVNVPLSNDESVHGVRLAAGLNRAYLDGTLRADGRQNLPTGVSGVAIQRGDQFGPRWVGDAFVPESAGSVVAHFAIDRRGNELTAEHRLYPDDQWGEREFLASTHERFRPVDADFGPDGALWVLDMYRGVIQHAEFVSDHLRAYIEKHGLEEPGATGRIWRVVREDRPVPRRPPALGTLAERLAGLEHPNAWVRDRAQRSLAADAAPQAIAALRRLDDFGSLGRRHALWTLDRAGKLDAETWTRALRDEDASVRIVGLRAGESLLGGALADRDGPSSEMLREVVARLEDGDPAVRLQAIHTLGALPPGRRPLDWMLAAGRSGDPLTAQAVTSGLSGLELEALRRELETATEPGPPPTRWLERLAMAAQLGAGTSADPAREAARLLDLVESVDDEETRIALLAGIRAAQRSPAGHRIELAGPHPLFDANRPAEEDENQSIARVRRGFTWPGDPRPGGARALRADEERRRAHGEILFADSCAACHGADGRGIEGQAPTLVGSPWVRDADDWLVRIVLQGLTGPVLIDGEEWNLTMPGHGGDQEFFGDEALAGLLTYVRRAWGHAEDPISPETVARIRAETRERARPWTVAELRALDVEHRLDRYVGAYEVPLVGTELIVVRQEDVLAVGQRGTGKGEMQEAGDGLFLGPGVTLQFEENGEGAVESAQVTYGGFNLTVAKTK